MADKTTVAQVVNYLAAAYPNFVLPPDTIRVYAEALSGMSGQRLKAAARECVKGCKFFPTVAELNEAGQRVRIESQHKELAPGVMPYLTPPDARLCPKCKGMRFLYMPKPNRPDWDVTTVACDQCTTPVDMEAEPHKSWRR